MFCSFARDLGQGQIHGRRIFFNVFAVLGARDGHNVLALCQHPGQGKLPAVMPASAASCFTFSTSSRLRAKFSPLKRGWRGGSRCFEIGGGFEFAG